jgi:hypothetical protein
VTMNRRPALACIIAVPALLLALLPPSPSAARHAPSPVPASAGVAHAAPRVIPALGQQPLLFVTNRGQIAGGAAFYTDSRDMRMAFGVHGVAVTVLGAPEGGSTEPQRRPGVTLTGGREELDPATGEVRLGGTPEHVQPPVRQRHTVQLDFVGSDSGSQPEGRDRAPTVVSYFKGPRSEWQTGLPTYHELVYRDLWPGIDLVYTSATGQLKQEFIVQPGADPARIRLAWRGAMSVRLDPTGNMEIVTPAGAFTDAAPVAYQEAGGRRSAVSAAYGIRGAATSGARMEAGVAHGPGVPDRRADRAVEYGFDLAPYDRMRPLVIDPAIFVYGGFFGSTGTARGLGIAVDARGSAYFCGQTPAENGVDDAYAVKVSADGTHYDYIAFLGGDLKDTCFDIGVDPDGNAYLTGVATSSETSFPVTVGPDLTHNGGSDDTLVAKIDPTGTKLVYAGYLGGAGFDFGEGIRVAADGSVYLSGIAGSRESSFPAVVGPDLTYNGNYDAYLCKLKPVPDAADPKANYDYCGYIGGSQEDIGRFTGNDGGVSLTAGHVAIDADGHAYASGMTRSDQSTFPDGDGFGDLAGPDNTFGGVWDAWVAKVKADGTGLVYAGYLGGSGQDEGYGAGVDAAGAFYFTGGTQSRTDFPARVGPDLTYNGGVSDAFVAKVAPDGSHYEYAGFIGGECRTDCGPDSDELGVGLTVDAEGHAYPIGWTYGTGTTFPTVGGPDLTPNGALVSLPDDAGVSGDAWVARVRAVPDAATVTDNFDFIGYIGGARWDAAFWVALDGRGGVYVAGDTESDGSTFPNGGGLGAFVSPRSTRAGTADAFVVKIVYDPTGPTLTPEPTPGPTRTPGTTPTPVGSVHLPLVLRGVRSGSAAPNRLHVVHRGDRADYLANDTLLGSVTDADLIGDTWLGHVLIFDKVGPCPGAFMCLAGDPVFQHVRPLFRHGGQKDQVAPDCATATLGGVARGEPAAQGPLALPATPSRQQALEANVLIHVGPFYGIAVSQQTPIPSFRWRGRGQTWIPGQRDAELASIRELQGQAVVVDRGISDDRRFLKHQSSHARPPVAPPGA